MTNQRKITAGSKSLPTAGNWGNPEYTGKDSNVSAWEKPGETGNELCTHNYGNHRESGCLYWTDFLKIAGGRNPLRKSENEKT